MKLCCTCAYIFTYTPYPLQCLCLLRMYHTCTPHVPHMYLDGVRFGLARQFGSAQGERAGLTLPGGSKGAAGAGACCVDPGCDGFCGFCLSIQVLHHHRQRAHVNKACTLCLDAAAVAVLAMDPGFGKEGHTPP